MAGYALMHKIKKGHNMQNTSCNIQNNYLFLGSYEDFQFKVQKGRNSKKKNISGNMHICTLCNQNQQTETPHPSSRVVNFTYIPQSKKINQFVC